MFDLERYAGWLARDRVSVVVRADVRALEAAMLAGAETAGLLLTLDKDIQRLPGGGVRKMLRHALGEMRSVLQPGAHHAGEGERA